MAHYKSDNRVRDNRYDGKYVKGPKFPNVVLGSDLVITVCMYYACAY